MLCRIATFLGLLVLLGTAPVSAGAAAEDPPPLSLTPTESCPAAEIERLQRVISFVRDQSWSEDPGSTAFLLNPDTATCRVVLKIREVSPQEEAALERGGEGRLSIERTPDSPEPSRLPLLLWAVFGGAGVVFVYRRYGRR